MAIKRDKIGGKLHKESAIDQIRELLLAFDPRQFYPGMNEVEAEEAVNEYLELLIQTVPTPEERKQFKLMVFSAAELANALPAKTDWPSNAPDPAWPFVVCPDLNEEVVSFCTERQDELPASPEEWLCTPDKLDMADCWCMELMGWDGLKWNDDHIPGELVRLHRSPFVSASVTKDFHVSEGELFCGRRATGWEA